MSLLITPSNETRVNTTTAGDQQVPTVAALSDGGYVVTWMSNGQDGNGWGIYAQRYDVTGDTVGSETRVNTTTAGDQAVPTIAALSDGGYVVTWVSAGQDGSGYGIYAQRYDATGNTVGSETRVNTTTAGDQSQPTVAALSGGGYVVTWVSAGQDGSGSGIYAQRYDATGNTVGSETRVNTTTVSDQLSPSVAALSEGGYVVTWVSAGQDGSGYGIYAQRYDATGDTVGSETRVNTTTAGDQSQPTVAALSGGGYVVTWMSGHWPDGQDGSGSGIYAQRYDATGNTVGSETRVNTTTVSDQLSPSVAALSEGGYVVTWQSLGPIGTTFYHLYAQQYDQLGNAVGGEIPVNTTAFDQGLPSVAALSGGGYVVTWMSGADAIGGRHPSQDGSGWGVYSRVFSESQLTAPLSSVVEFVVGTTGDDTILANPGALGAGDRIDGGAGTDVLALNSAGTLDVTLPSFFSGIEALQGSTGDDVLIVNAERLAGVQTIDGNTGTDRLQFSGSLDVSGKTLVSIEQIHGSANYDSLQLTAAQLGNLQSLDQVEQVNAASPGTFDFSSLTVGGLGYVYGSSGDDTFVLTPSEAAALNNLDGQSGSDTLRLSEAGTINLTGSSGGGLVLYSVEAFQGSSGNDSVVIDQSVLSVGLGSIAGGGGTDTVSWRNGSLDLTSLTSLTGVEKLEGSSSGDTLYLNLANLAGQPSLEGGAGTDFLSLDLTTATGAISGNLSDPVPNLQIGGLGGIQVTGFETFDLRSGSGNDILTGAALHDYISGGDGNDVLDGAGGGDYLLGQGGNDTLYSRLGEGPPAGGYGETLDGGSGIDFAFVDRSDKSSSFTLDLADPSLGTALGDGTVIQNVEQIAFYAGSGSDNLSGGDLADVLSGGAGSDILSGRGGDDTLIGGIGLDTIDGGAGNDTAVYTGNWADYSIKVSGDVVDIIDLRAASPDGADRLIGVENFQFSDGTIALNALVPNEAPTAVALANATTSILENTPTATHIKVADINVTDDALGSNILALTGADAAFFEIVGSALYLKAGTVLDFESKTSYAVAVTVDDPTVGTTPDATSTIYALNVSNVPGVTITGTSAANTIDATHTVAGQPFPTNEEDTINAGGGNDTINALGGNDFINGGAGADTMFGGTGNDTYVVDNSGDIVNETGGNGLDTVQSSITFSLSDAVHAIGVIENLTLTGTAAINGTGNVLANVITGNSGQNVLAGLGGADTLDGGAGIDTATYAASAAGVTVSLATGIASGGDAQGDTLLNIENLTGSALNDTLEGNGSNNVLVGGAGTDTISYADAASGVAVSLAVTAAQNTGGAGSDTLSGFENLTGSAFGDALTGSSSANVLMGLDGNDTIFGFVGADTVDGGTGTDTIVLSSTSTGLNTASDTQIIGVEAVSAASSAAGVTIDLHNQGEGFTITGSASRDIITGGTGNDLITGADGGDTLRGGGGSDSFIFTSITNSQPGANKVDTVADFTHGSDHFDFSAISGLNSTNQNVTINIITGPAPTSIAAHTIDVVISGGNAVIYANASGATETINNNHEDMQINLTGVTSLSASDFLLHL